MNDGRTERDRLATAQESIDRGRSVPPDGAAAVLAVTTSVSSYPGTPQAYYAMQPSDLDGSEVEGAGSTAVSNGAPVFYAWNAGTQIPPRGTAVVCHAVGGRWVFRYDG